MAEEPVAAEVEVVVVEVVEAAAAVAAEVEVAVGAEVVVAAAAEVAVAVEAVGRRVHSRRRCASRRGTTSATNLRPDRSSGRSGRFRRGS